MSFYFPRSSRSFVRSRSSFGRGVSFKVSVTGGASAAPPLPPSPDQIADLNHWYAAVTGAVGISWVDKTLSASNLTQSVATKQPAWSAADALMSNNGAWTFDGGDSLKAQNASDWKFLNDGTGCTIAIVGRYTGSGTQAWFDTRRGNSTNPGMSLFVAAATGIPTWLISSGSVSVFSAGAPGGTIPVNDIHVVVLRYMSGGIPGTTDEYRMRVDGALVASGSAATAPCLIDPIDPLTVGARSDTAGVFLAAGGKISELITYSRALTDGEVSGTLSSYLSASWGKPA